MAFAHFYRASTGVVFLALAMGLGAGCRSVSPSTVQIRPSREARTWSPPTGKLSAATDPPAAAAAAGCAEVQSAQPVVAAVERLPPTAAEPQRDIQRVAFPEPVVGVPVGPAAPDDGMFCGQEALDVQPLVELVVARNPTVEAMADAWRAAAHRYPQVVALDDPVLMAMTAPASYGSNTVQPAYVLGGSQKIPWFGKREARGRMAQAEANAAFQDIQAARLQAVETARFAYFEYYLVDRQLDLNAEDRESKLEFRRTASTRYQANLVSQRDVLSADLALAEVDRRQLELVRMRRVAVARINTLLLRTPDAPLPPPPARLDLGAEPAAPEMLRSLAIQQRPDLAALGAKITAEQAAVSLAAKEFYPDVEVYGRYDSFWQPAATQAPLRPQVGLNMNVPLYRQKRYAALHEAEFRLNQRRAEYQQRLADIQLEVQDAYEQVLEARKAALLYTEKFLPAAEDNLNVARADYAVGRVNFLLLLAAQQQLISVRDKQQQAVADYYRRLAALERIVAGEVPTGER